MKKQAKQPKQTKPIAADDLAKVIGGAGGTLGGTPVNPVGPHG